MQHHDLDVRVALLVELVPDLDPRPPLLYAIVSRGTSGFCTGGGYVEQVGSRGAPRGRPRARPDNRPGDVGPQRRPGGTWSRRAGRAAFGRRRASIARHARAAHRTGPTADGICPTTAARRSLGDRDVPPRSSAERADALPTRPSTSMISRTRRRFGTRCGRPSCARLSTGAGRVLPTPARTGTRRPFSRARRRSTEVRGARTVATAAGRAPAQGGAGPEAGGRRGSRRRSGTGPPSAGARYAGRR